MPPLGLGVAIHKLVAVSGVIFGELTTGVIPCLLFILYSLTYGNQEPHLLIKSDFQISIVRLARLLFRRRDRPSNVSPRIRGRVSTVAKFEIWGSPLLTRYRGLARPILSCFVATPYAWGLNSRSGNALNLFGCTYLGETDFTVQTG